MRETDWPPARRAEGTLIEQAAAHGAGAAPGAGTR